MIASYRYLLTIFLVLLILGQNTSYGQPKTFNTYRGLANMQSASPGAYKFGLYGFSNPAILEYLNAPFDMMLSMNTNGPNPFADQTNSWGIFTGLGNLGVGAYTRPVNTGGWVTDYRISMATGNKDLSFGFGYGFAGENKSAAGLSNLYNLGILYRPIENLSFGVVYTKALESSFNEAVFDLSVRPIGSWPLTFYGDYSITTANEDWGDLAILGNANSLATWSAGASLEILDGLRLNYRYTDSEFDGMDMQMGGVDLSLGAAGLATNAFQPQSDGMPDSYTTHFRLGASDRTVLDDITVFENFVKLDLSGAITYRPYKFFDKRQSFFDILKAIDLAAKDDNITGLFVNAVNMQGSYSIKWEIREKLKEFREEYGKEVVIFIEREGMTDYHFASIADKIVIDELGSIELNGFRAGRSYYKNMLDKIGIGFTELRYFKYKSAVESYSRTDFSEGDREQREMFINDWYEIAREEITEQRDIDSDKFDEIVSGKLSYDAQELIDLGLVDVVGRWNQLDELKSELAPGIDFTINAGSLYKTNEPIDDQWSLDNDYVAVIYANGVCAMEGGINARTLWRYVEMAVKNPSIGAIVLRVDSPGGDPLASEYIAKIVRDNKDKKPIIVSQGMLAASGGYWLSMDADEIFTTPMTITGSIGVISGWIYDKGLQDTLGITTDMVKVGKYADLGFAWQDPLLGIGLPVRDLTEDEEELRKTEILELYDDFVKRVADGRSIDEEEVKEVAQGRVWTGKRAMGINLVDKIGGLSAAMKRAAELIDSDNEVLFVEYPPRSNFDFQRLVPELLPINVKTVSKSVERVNFLVGLNGKALPMLPIDWQLDPNFQNPDAD